MRSIKLVVLLLSRFILKYSIPCYVSLGLVFGSRRIRPPLKINSNVKFGPSPDCETSVYLITARFFWLLWRLLTAPLYHRVITELSLGKGIFLLPMPARSTSLVCIPLNVSDV
ncbi:hypothetical protein, partial [Carboxylicivirga caseinilyticus]|uniref:hypothetical protein n=1 Tax=Carboxylicivirga caseinilyticus TaxID=3417572 RepID=UPI003D32DC33|nr:hypothetical protein [Marinilabiliaceae bacterium A049]